MDDKSGLVRIVSSLYTPAFAHSLAKKVRLYIMINVQEQQKVQNKKHIDGSVTDLRRTDQRTPQDDLHDLQSELPKLQVISQIKKLPRQKKKHQ